MRHVRREKGQSLLEWALILPVLLIILAGMLDLGRLYYVYVAITDAAAEGVAYAAMNPHDTNGTFARAQEASSGLVEIEEGMVTIDYSTVASGAPVTVTVGYSFTLATPLINAMVPDGALVLRAVANEAILIGEF